MKVNGIRVSLVVLDILDELDNAAPGNPAWGLRICEQTGHGTGTVYPALDKLLKAGWITDRWEKPQPADRPRRRYYDLTDDGRAAYGKVLAARAAWSRTVTTCWSPNSWIT
jgi:DNA-binding PadR family transcriptional regulator